MKFHLMGMAALSRRTRFISAAWNPFLLGFSVIQRSHSTSGHDIMRSKPPKKASSSSSSSSSSPWLMLPPTFDGDQNMVYQFYSLADNKVVSIDKKKKGSSEEEEEEVPDDECAIVGSSHGWLALLDRENCDLFLSNPISGRHIKLPPIHNQLPHIPLDDLRWWINKLIISTSDPENNQDCRAMLSYGDTNDQLAFCCTSSTSTHKHWSLLPAAATGPFTAKPNLFLCCGGSRRLEAWDLGDPLSPIMTPIANKIPRQTKVSSYRSKAELQLKRYMCVKDSQFLVVEEGSDQQIFHVKQYVLDRVGPDGSHVDSVYYGPRGEGGHYDDSVPYKTVGFDVHKYDPETGSFVYMDRDLGGLALFVGNIDGGFALSPDDFPGLKPNSIYYTDTSGGCEYSGDLYGGYDLGIFDYDKATFSSCYYPCGLKSMFTKIQPIPRWFTPSIPAFN